MVSEEFLLAIVSTGTYVAVDCCCGITHFVNEADGAYEEGEYEKLMRNKEKNPEEYVESPEDVIRHGNWGEETIVVSCSCGKAEEIENMIWDNRGVISSYLNAALKKEVEETTSDMEQNSIG